ncbi:hypothetical protein GCM10009544_45140 [Streptomyces stramineus]|uniref:Uncharacterized protein n=1 Tax=Streptomyces stramineus TaxID=173861 RepID=A0ABP3KEU5_9ACTN
MVSYSYGAAPRRRVGRTAARRSRIIDMAGSFTGRPPVTQAWRNAARNGDVVPLYQGHVRKSGGASRGAGD